MNLGSSNRTAYDKCNYQKRLHESTQPLSYALYEGKYENCSKCIYDKFYTPMDLVSIESELRGQTRPLSNCDQFQYNPHHRRSKRSISTFDKNVPVVLAPEICPIVHNNLSRVRSNGIHLPNPNFCADI